MPANNTNDVENDIYIVPHTHWDREWYQPFQKFRYNLVKLINELLKITKAQEFYFTLDGQTVVIEDYLEIRPEKQDELVQEIRKGNITVGPWYVLPDEWLVGQESLIRNLEFGYHISQKYTIPIMQVGYLPDQFGHTCAIPQLLADVTDIKVAIIWRGVSHELSSVPFSWKRSKDSKASVLGIYLPFGYGNAASLPNNIEDLQQEIQTLVTHLKPFSPISWYLLLNGEDHQFPNASLPKNLSKISLPNTCIHLTTLEKAVIDFQKKITQINFSPVQYTGEFRSPARAHMLQDTYSARLWIKQWNSKVEDLLVAYAEPMHCYGFILGMNYPIAYLLLAWKWLLQNQPHDSICGCSVDTVHEEMKARFSWAETIALATIDELTKTIKNPVQNTENLTCVVYNPTNMNAGQHFITFTLPFKKSIICLESNEGQQFFAQKMETSTEIVWEMTVGALRLKTLMKMLPGRKIMNFYVNELLIFDGSESGNCEARIIVGDKPVGDLDITSKKKEFLTMVDEKKYHKIHILVTRETQNQYCAVVPLQPWGFTSFKIKFTSDTIVNTELTIHSKDKLENAFYSIKFNKDGSLFIRDKQLQQDYPHLHWWQDTGDRGDEYTYGHVDSANPKIKIIRRKILNKNALFCDIEQNITLELFKELNPARNKRSGHTPLQITSRFRFYAHSPRIDVISEFTNTAKDHRLRICFDIPFKPLMTITSTHFGAIERQGNPEGTEGKQFTEKPSGIQSQKRYIRVEDKGSNLAVTLINKGLPEVELVNNNYLALTLLRSIGWLSRGDIPERPDHAGPYIATPGAQEYNKTITCEYSILIHDAQKPLSFTENHAEQVNLSAKVIVTPADIAQKLSIPILNILNPNIRISSLRMTENWFKITLFNLSNIEIKTKVNLHPQVVSARRIKLDSKILSEITINSHSIDLLFLPHEIQIIEVK